MNRCADRRRSMYKEKSISLATFAGVNISPAPLYYDGSKFTIKDDDWNHSSYNSKWGLSAGSYYFNWSQSKDISVSYKGFSDWRMPTNSELATIFKGPRSGSTINGTSSCIYAMLRLTGVSFCNTMYPYGILLAPDGKTMTGLSRSFTWNVDSSSGNQNVTNAQLNEYLEQGCEFFPYEGRRNPNWNCFEDGGNFGYYFATDSYSSSDAYSVYVNTNMVKVNNIFPKNFWLMCRPVRTA